MRDEARSDWRVPVQFFAVAEKCCKISTPRRPAGTQRSCRQPLGVQPEEQLITERQVAMVEVLLKTRDGLDLGCDRIERPEIVSGNFEGRGDVAVSHSGL